MHPTAVHADHRVTADRRAIDDVSGPYLPVTSDVTEERVAELEGQLQMAIEPESDGVVVALTRARTNLTGRRLGEQVNVETDLLARCVEQLIADAEGSGP